MDVQELKKIVEELLSKMGVSFEIVSIEHSDVHPAIMITSKDEQLIGVNGETLQALNHVVKRITEKKYGEEGRHFMLDVNNFQKKKIDGKTERR